MASGAADLVLVRAYGTDIAILVEMNRVLIADEGGVPRDDLASEMTEAMAAGFCGVVFWSAGEVAGYAMYLVTPNSIFVNHFFVSPVFRGRGLGRAAFAQLQAEWFPVGLPVTLSVMDSNVSGIAFWKAIGFLQSSVNLELAPGGSS